MANRTVKDAQSIKGTNPQYLVEKIIRTRIYECKFWKEECFALSAELLVDKGMQLKFMGGVYGGNIKPSSFLCLILKMLQIQPEKDIIVEFIRNEDFKYVRALGAMYMRLTGTSTDCYKYLEPLYNDYRKLKRQKREGAFELIHMDEFIDELLREERVCDIILPRLQKRQILEELNELEPRVSALEDDLDDIEESDEEMDLAKDVVKDESTDRHRSGYRDWDKPKRSPSPRFRRSRSRSPRKREKVHDRDDRKKEERKDRSKRHRSRSKDRKRRSRSRDRKRDDDKRHHKSSKKSKHDRDHKHRSHGHGSSSAAGGGSSSMDKEIAEANELRAKLGLPPLR